MNGLMVRTTTSMPAERGLPLWVSMWTDIFGRTSAPLESDAFGRELFNGQIECTELGRSKLCRIKTTAHRVSRNSVSPPHADSRGFKVLVQTRGASTVEQAGRCALLSPGEWTIYDAGKPYRISNPDVTEQYVVVLQRDAFAGSQLQMDEFVAQTFSARAGVGRLACGIVRDAFEEFTEHHLESTEDLGDTIARLFQQALLEHSGHESHASRGDVLRDRIKRYVERNLRDPELSLDRLALELNHTKRNLHRVFGAEGKTINTYIWDMRLKTSKRALLDPGTAHRSITEVAYACGFSSSAHFSRSFKEAFGMSPSDYRRKSTVAD